MLSLLRTNLICLLCLLIIVSFLYFCIYLGNLLVNQHDNRHGNPRVSQVDSLHVNQRHRYYCTLFTPSYTYKPSHTIYLLLQTTLTHTFTRTLTRTNHLTPSTPSLPRPNNSQVDNLLRNLRGNLLVSLLNNLHRSHPVNLVFSLVYNRLADLHHNHQGNQVCSRVYNRVTNLPDSRHDFHLLNHHGILHGNPPVVLHIHQQINLPVNLRDSLLPSPLVNPHDRYAISPIHTFHWSIFEHYIT